MKKETLEITSTWDSTDERRSSHTLLHPLAIYPSVSIRHVVFVSPWFHGNTNAHNFPLCLWLLFFWCGWNGQYTILSMFFNQSVKSSSLSLVVLGVAAHTTTFSSICIFPKTNHEEVLAEVHQAYRITCIMATCNNSPSKRELLHSYLHFADICLLSEHIFLPWTRLIDADRCWKSKSKVS